MTVASDGYKIFTQSKDTGEPQPIKEHWAFHRNCIICIDVGGVPRSILDVSMLGMGIVNYSSVYSPLLRRTAIVTMTIIVAIGLKLEQLPQQQWQWHPKSCLQGEKYI